MKPGVHSRILARMLENCHREALRRHGKERVFEEAPARMLRAA